MLTTLGIGAGCALLVLGIFQILKLKRGVLDIPIAYLELKESINYLALDEMVAMRKRRWLNYLIFRFTPLLISIMLGIGIAQSFRKVGFVNDLLLGAVAGLVSSIPHWKALVGARGYCSVQLIHFVMLLCGSDCAGCSVAGSLI